MSSFKDRCHIATKCLPDAKYKDCLERLHKEMLDKIAELEFYKENRTCMGCWGVRCHCDCGQDSTRTDKQEENDGT